MLAVIKTLQIVCFHLQFFSAWNFDIVFKAGNLVKKTWMTTVVNCLLVRSIDDAIEIRLEVFCQQHSKTEIFNRFTLL